MSRMRDQAISGLKVGDTFVFSRIFSREETETFGDLTRDYNPVHYDPRFAAAKGFDGLICHGLLVGGMICEIGGQVGWLAGSMQFKFIHPVYFGDEITCRLTITNLGEGNKAEAEADFFNQGGVKVLEAKLGGKLPGHAERQVLALMKSEGDPTNKRDVS